MFFETSLVLAAILSVTPSPQRTDPACRWQRRLAEKRALVAAGGSRVVFLGDSITDFFERAGAGCGKTVWDRYWARDPYRALNLGYSSDHTDHLLWRLTEGGELDGYEAKAVVLMIGVNNVGQRDDPAADVICGVKRVLETIRAKQPTARTVLCAILPIGDRPDHPCRRRIATVNRELQKFADGRRVVWCDFTERFLLPDGTISRDLLPDGVHPQEEGYYVWTAAVLPLVNAILKDDGMPIASVYPTRPCAEGLTPNENRASLRPVARFCQPDETGPDGWGDRLLRNRNLIRDLGDEIDVVLVGDASVRSWKPADGEARSALENARAVLDLGYPGDRVQNVLWRLRNGELDGYRAKMVVLSVGDGVADAEGESPAAADVAAGVEACLDEIRRRQPQAKVVRCQR